MRRVAIVYVWPGDDITWAKQLALLGPDDIAIVTGSNNGPDSPADPRLVNHISEARARGVTVLGYVATDYGRRASLLVEADATTWHETGVDGLFLDEWADTLSNHSFGRAWGAIRAWRKPSKANPTMLIVNPGKPMPIAYWPTKDATTGLYQALVVEYEGVGHPSFPAPHPWSVAIVYRSSDVAGDYAALFAGGWQYGWVTVDGADGNPFDGPAVG